MHRFTRDELDRSEKLLIDILRDPGEASRRLEAARCNVLVGPELLGSRLAQIAMLTIAATLSRSHRSGVMFVIDHDVALLVRGKNKTALIAELQLAGGTIGIAEPGAPIIAIGDADVPARSQGVRLLIDRGRCGCVPLTANAPFNDDGFGPSAILAASLAALEIFRLNALGETDAGADEKIVQLVPDDTTAALRDLENALPERLWYIGVGHLGQAGLFGATLCGKTDDQRVYKLQDHDEAISANRSTQLLLERDAQGSKKIEVCKRWLAERGIDVKLDPLPLDESTPPDPDFGIIIAGLDKPEPRRLLEAPGAQLVIDAGIGGLSSTFASFRIHVFPGPERAERVFARTGAISEAMHREALADFYADQVDDDPEHICGARDVAGVSVGVPFVGTAVAALVLAELMMRQRGLSGNWKLGGDLRQSSPLSFKLPAEHRKEIES